MLAGGASRTHIPGGPTAEAAQASPFPLRLFRRGSKFRVQIVKSSQRRHWFHQYLTTTLLPHSGDFLRRLHEKAHLVSSEPAKTLITHKEGIKCSYKETAQILGQTDTPHLTLKPVPEPTHKLQPMTLQHMVHSFHCTLHFPSHDFLISRIIS